MTMPNLFNEFFDFDKIPVIKFDDIAPSTALPSNMWITDTTFRDGQQSRRPYKVEEIVQLYKYLHLLGGKYGVIKQTEFFLYGKNDQVALEKCKELNYKFPEIETDIVPILGVRIPNELCGRIHPHIFWGYAA